MSIEKRTSVDQLIPGMVLAEPVFHPMSMQMIWNSGTTLTPKHIALLQKMNLGGIRVMEFVPASPQSAALATAIVPSVPLDQREPAEVPSARPEPSAPRPHFRPPAAAPVPSALRGPGPAAAPPHPPAPLAPAGRAALAPRQPAPVRRPSWERLPEPLKQPQRIREEVLERNCNIVRHVTESVRHSSRIDFNQVDLSVQTTIKQIVQHKELLENLIDLRVYDEYTYAHSANVMSLALVVGTALNYPVERLRVLGIGALLHDIGKTLVPEEILNKPEKLSEEEFRIMATHPANGIMILSNYPWATNDIRNCAFQHHEKFGGQGYPMGLKGSQIAELAQVVAIVDFYDALISDRVYKKGLPPNVVYQAIMNGVNQHFDARIVQAFLKFIVPYPVNSQVLLSTGQSARVLRVNRKNLLAPVVVVEGQGEVDLARHPEVAIATIERVAREHPTFFNPPAIKGGPRGQGLTER